MAKATECPVTLDQRYVSLHSKLGGGGMGDVFLFRETSTGRQVAVKRLKPRLLTFSDAADRFHREALILTRLNNESIVAAHDIVWASGQLYLITEFVEGVTLAAHLRSLGSLSPRDTCRLLQPVALALHDAHEIGIIHRDIKPANLMVRTDGLCKLLDFGIAKLSREINETTRAVTATTAPGVPETFNATVIEAANEPRNAASAASAEAPGMTETFSFIGTPGYASPEQLANSRSVGPLADAFAFAAVVYECLAGNPVFGSGSNEERRANTISGNLAARPPLPAHVPDRLKALLFAALSIDPDDRVFERSPITLRVLAAELNRAMETQLDKTARSILLPRRLTSFVGRHQQVEEITGTITHPAGGPAIMTLTGPGGIGKTRLALACASEATSRFGRRVYFAELAKAGTSEAPAGLSDVDAVRDAVQRAIGRTDTDLGIEELLAQEAEISPVLVVLDNCEHIAASVCAVVERAQSLAPAGQLVFLATSRCQLGIPGEHLYSVPPLAAPEKLPGDRPSGPQKNRLLANESVELFRQRILLGQRNFSLTGPTLNQVAEICRKLQGMPLAIEWAAAQAARTNVKHVFDELTRRLVLTGSDTEDLKKLVNWSLTNLEPSRRGVLEQLSVFADGFSADAAAAIVDFSAAGLPEPADRRTALFDALSELVMASTLTIERSDESLRYVVPVTIRQFCRDAAPESLLAGARRRLASWALATAEQQAAVFEAGKAQNAVGVVRVEIENFREVWRLLDPQSDGDTRGVAADRQDTGFPLDCRRRLALALHRYFYMSGPRNEGLAWITRAIDLHLAAQTGAISTVKTPPGEPPIIPLDPPDPLLGKLCRAAGVIAHGGADWSRAERWARAGLAIFTRLDDAVEITKLQNNLGTSLAGQRRFQEALEMQERALSGYLSRGENKGAAGVLLNMSFTAIERDDWPEAERLAVAAWDALSRTDDKERQAAALHNRALARMRQRNFNTSETDFREAIQLRQSIPDHNGTVHSLIYLCACKFELGKVQDSAKLLGYAKRRADLFRSPINRATRKETEALQERINTTLSPATASALSMVYSEERSVLELPL